MLIQCISVVSVLSVVILGLLVMARVVSLEEVSDGICRAFGMLVIALIAFCVLKGFCY